MYNLLEKTYIQEIKSDAYLYEHNKTKAKVVILKNQDPNKTFCIGFKTLPSDDTGVAHIVEHCVLCGSKKYPVKDAMMAIDKSSVNTYLNAMTYPHATFYPIASCNLQDYKNLTDVYMDAVFNPKMYEKEEIFKQEGWHYELDDINSSLIYNGIVYNEMKGVSTSIDYVSEQCSLRALFPNNLYSKDIGGDPLYIPHLSYQEFLNFHKKYYHPSNAYIYLYGDIDIEERLDYLDKEYLSKYTYQEIDTLIEESPKKHVDLVKGVYQANLTEPKYATITYVLPSNLDALTKYAINLTLDVLINRKNSPLYVKLMSHPNIYQVSYMVDFLSLQPTITITTTIKEYFEKEYLENTINETIKEIIDNGFNKDLLNGIIKSIELSSKLQNIYAKDLGIALMVPVITSLMFNSKDHFTSIDRNVLFNEVKSLLNTNYLENILNKYLYKNDFNVTCFIEPSEDVLDIKEAKIKEELSNFKNSKSKEELLNLIKEQEELIKYQDEKDSLDAQNTIPTLSIKDINKLDINISNNTTTYNGINVVQHDYDYNGVYSFEFLFDITDISKENLKTFALYYPLLTYLDTLSYTVESLTLKKLEVGRIHFNIKPVYGIHKEDKLFFSIYVETLHDDIKEAIELVNEIIYNTKFDDVNKLEQEMLRIDNIIKSEFINYSHRKTTTRLLSYYSKLGFLEDSLYGVERLKQSIDCIKNKEYASIKTNISNLIKYIFTKEKLLISFNGKSEFYQEFKKYLPYFVDKLSDNDTFNNELNYQENNKQEALSIPTDVTYVGLSGNFTNSGLKYHGSLRVVENILRNEYLWKQIRLIGGAYGCTFSISKKGDITFVSYRDPSVDNTLDKFYKVSKYLKELDISSEELNNFIVGACSIYSQPNSIADLASNSLRVYLNGITIDDLENEYNELINTKLIDIHDSSKYFDAINKLNNICVIGNNTLLSKSILFKNKETLF